MAARRSILTPARVFVILLVVFVLGLGFLPQYWRVFVSDPDRYHLSLERSLRLAWYRSGWKLNGAPDSATIQARLDAAGLKLGAPIFMRIFKHEFELELWIKDGETFRHFATYPICRYSGWLGPKLKQGDRQAPEGVYTVSKNQLNPNSRWHRSFNLGYPNRFDRAHARTGNYLMVHGGCSSAGCYAMTNDTIDEIWALVTAALNAGQPRFQVQIFPFRLSEPALQARKDHEWAAFWRQLKPAYDLFEQAHVPPRVNVCKNEYRFEPARTNTSGSAKIANSCKPNRSS